MTKLSSRLALLAVAGVLAAVSPALAANGNGSVNSNGASMALDCSLPINLTNPLCTSPPNNRNPNRGNNGPSGNNGPNGNGPNGNSGQNDNGGRNYDGGPRSGTFNFNQHYRSQFDQRFRGYNFGDFGFFASPDFSITIGTPLPYHYHMHLRPVPSTIYDYYPWFRGYLYFVDRRGDFVIVSPRSYHIVAVL